MKNLYKNLNKVYNSDVPVGEKTSPTEIPTPKNTFSEERFTEDNDRFFTEDELIDDDDRFFMENEEFVEDGLTKSDWEMYCQMFPSAKTKTHWTDEEVDEYIKEIRKDRQERGEENYFDRQERLQAKHDAKMLVWTGVGYALASWLTKPRS